MHASKVKVGGRYNLKLFGTVREVDVVGFQSYEGKEKPRKIWSVVETNTGKCYSVFSARSFVGKVSDEPRPPDPQSENELAEVLASEVEVKV